MKDFLTAKQKLFLAFLGLIIIIGLLVLIYRTYFLITPEFQNYQEVTTINKDNQSDGGVRQNQSIDNESQNMILVYFVGAVKKPGIYQIKKGLRLFEAIGLAGGFSSEADLSKVNLIQKCKDGQRINVPILKNKIRTKKERSVKEITDVVYPLDLNKADYEELISVPGIGKTLAQRIIEYRKLNGRFNSYEELGNVKGFSLKKLKDMEAFFNEK